MLLLKFFVFFIVLISNDYCKEFYEKPSSFIMNFEGFYEVLLLHKCFWSKNFWQWNNDPFKIFCDLPGNTFCFFAFLNERNIKTTLLVINLKCFASTFKLHKQVVLKLLVVKCAISGFFGFFWFLIYLYFNEAFVKNFTGKLSFFNKNFQKFFQEVVCYIILSFFKIIWKSYFSS